MTLSPLDDYPVHQVAQVMRHPATSDRNFYDRYYFNCHPCGGEMMLIVGVGQYPNLGVTDGFALVRRGDRHQVVRASRELGADRMDTAVGPLRVEVLEGLKKLRVVLEPNDFGLDFDLTWDAAIPAQLEPRHFIRWQERTVFDSMRLAQTGRWQGHVNVGGEEVQVTPDRWWGSRDRSWGVRPVGEPEPPGIQARNPAQFYWMYAPMQFSEFSILTIVQEDASGNRILDEAVRVWADPAKPPEPLGRPEYRPDYTPGTRDVRSAAIAFHPPGARALEVSVTPLLPVSLMAGTGYGLEPDWRHGMYQGPDLVVQGVTYDLSRQEDRARMWGMVDSVARFECSEGGGPGDGAVGYGLFEYLALGEHKPTGLTA
ncbi:MAG: hypothetical protein ACM3ML_06225 [Micromonosporaceae bacterium]